MNTRSSVLLITVDCLRADHVGFLGYERPTTPFLDSMADESFVFPKAIVGGTPTYFSLPSIMASRPPLALGRDLIGLAPGEPSLASVLHASGYATAAFSAGNPYVSPRFGYDQGFDHFRDFLDPGTVVGTADYARPNRILGGLNRAIKKVSFLSARGRAAYNELYFQYCQRLATRPPRSLDELRRFPAADVLVDHARAWLSSIGQQPFFLWLHFMDPHAPYYPSAEALRMMGVDQITPLRARYLNSYWNRGDKTAADFHTYREEVLSLYDAGIRWVDAQIGRLIEILRRFRRWNDCMLAFTADHGEEFLEHGDRYHQPRKLTEELIHVPLLLRVPGVPRAKVSSAPFSLLHLAPTLLDAAGIRSPGEFHGRSQWRQILGGADWTDCAVVECVPGCTNPYRRESCLGGRLLAIRDRRYKLVLRFDSRSEELFDLDQDPMELNPLAADAVPSVRRRLLQAALAHLRQRGDQPKPRVSGLLRQMMWDRCLTDSRLPHAVPI